MDSPVLVKKTVGALLKTVPKGWLFGKKFRETRQAIKDSEFLSAEQLFKIQFAKLKDIIGYSYHNVPYYKRLFDEHSIQVERINSYGDIKQIPFLDKGIVKTNFNDLQSKTFNKRNRSYGTTGGTSGEPMGFYIDKGRSSIEWAFLTSMFERIGYTLNDRRLVLRGEPIKDKSGELWVYDPLLKQLSLSTFHMDQDHLLTYMKLIQNFKPHFIHGYPSAIITLAQFIKQNNVRLDLPLKGIIGISENIIKTQRDYIEEVFKTRFSSFYGHSEKLILAGECEKSNCYHVEPLYGFFEIINFNGESVVRHGEVGELVGTSFINHAMPFIRYRTGDIAEYNSEKCACGRNYVLIKNVQGRWIQEMLVTKSKSLISITALNVHSKVFDKVIRFQFEQKLPGSAVLKIVRMHNFSEKDATKIIDELNKKLDGQIDIQIIYVDEIATTKAGKFKFLQQFIDTSKYFPF